MGGAKKGGSKHGTIASEGEVGRVSKKRDRGTGRNGREEREHESNGKPKLIK